MYRNILFQKQIITNEVGEKCTKEKKKQAMFLFNLLIKFMSFILFF